MPALYPTANELFQVGRRAVITTPGTKINPVVVDVPGSNINLAVGTSAVMGQEVVKRGADAMRGAFIDTARGAQLDRVVFDRTGLTRFGAYPATVDLYLSRPTPGSATPGTYPAGSRVQTPDGTQFGTNYDVVFGDTDTEGWVSATALVAGTEGNVEKNTVTAFADKPFDTTLTVTNLDGAKGGTDTETDIKFIGRTRGFFPTLRRGIKGAIEYGAQQVPGVAVATASEVLNPTNSLPAAYVQLVIGDTNGGASSAMIQAVNDMLLQFRAFGITVKVLGGTVVYQAVNWKIGALTGYDLTTIINQIRALTVAVAQYLPPGEQRGTLYRSSLIAAARNVPGAIVSDDSLPVPALDVTPATPQTMIRVLSTSVTFTNA